MYRCFLLPCVDFAARNNPVDFIWKLSYVHFISINFLWVFLSVFIIIDCIEKKSKKNGNIKCIMYSM